MIDHRAGRCGLKPQLRDTESSGYGGKGRHRHEHRFGIWQVHFETLHHFGKRQVTDTIVGDDMD
jgi:hypothetical protein